jgi:hypothetical protein
MLTTISNLAYDALTERVSANDDAFFVYQDADSAFNHGIPSGFFGASNKIDVDAACIDDPAAANGCSTDPNVLDRDRGNVFRVTFDSLAGEFASLNFLSGPYDLRGATELVFEARSPDGVELLFGAAGQLTNVSIPPSASFETYAVPFQNPGALGQVDTLFTVEANDTITPSGGTVLLDNIRYNPVPVRQATELSLPLGNATFGSLISSSPPFPPDQVVRNLSTVYESSLTLLSLLDRGTPADLSGARAIASGLLYALQHDVADSNRIPVAADGSRGLHSGYQSGDVADAAGSSAQGPIRLPGFFTGSQFLLVQDGTTGGNNAFGILALLAAYRQFGSIPFLEGAREIGRWIVDKLADNTGAGFGGYNLGYADGGGPATGERPLLLGKSIENNADIFAAFSQLAAIERPLGNLADADFWQDRANHAGDFVMAMFDEGDPGDAADGHFYAGTLPLGTSPGPGVIPSIDPADVRGNDVINLADFLDSISFTVLALARAPQYRDAIDWREPVRYLLDAFDVSNGQGVIANGQPFHGFSIVEPPEPDVSRTNPSPDGISWEFTGQAVATMNFVDWLYGTSEFEEPARHFLNEIGRAQMFAPFGDGKGLVASTLHGEDETNSPFLPVDHCLTTPFQCIPERAGLAATNWAILAEHGINIFAPQLPLPPQTGQSFVVEDWNYKVTKTDRGFNYLGGNAGELNEPGPTSPTDEATKITQVSMSQDIPDATGESFNIDINFNRAPGGAGEFGGAFMSLFGLTDTLVSLDGSLGTKQNFPGYFLNFDDVFAGFGSFAGRSIEEIKFDVKLDAASQPFMLKAELKQEPDTNGDEFDVFKLVPVTNTNWSTVRLRRSDFDDSQEGSGNPAPFDWTEVSKLSFIVEKQVFDPETKVLTHTNPDALEFSIDNVTLVDNDGPSVDLEQIKDPFSGQLSHLYEEAFLDYVRETSSRYFVDFASTDPRTGGIIQDRSTFADLMTVGGAGFQLTSYVVDADRGYLPRDEAAQRVHDILRVLHGHSQGPQPVSNIGHEGFFYHFLGIDGLRKQNFNRPETTGLDESLNTVELSTIDTALAVAGAVTAGQYFDGNTTMEAEIQQMAEAIYARVNWPFMLDDQRFTNSNQFFLGWKPNETRDDDSGQFGRFKLDDDPQDPQNVNGQYSSKPDNGSEVPATIDFYTDEGLLIALLAMGSPNPAHQLPRAVWDAMIRDTDGGSFVKTFPGALFTYEFASVWLDTEALGTDNHPLRPTNFFENSRDAMIATRDYAIANPNDRTTWQSGGGETRWGISAAEGPFDDYAAFGAPRNDTAGLIGAALGRDAGFVASPARYMEEAENGAGNGSNMSRGNASGGTTVQLDVGETRALTIDVPFQTEYEVIVRYSNDSFLGPLEEVEVAIDGAVVGSFIAQDTGDGGFGWNVFLDSDPLGMVKLAPGPHVVDITVLSGDNEGVEIDKITLQHGPVFRPLENGTATVYGAGSAIKHAPEYAIPALWESYELDLLHPRVGFADAFHPEIADAVIDERPGGEILRTSGAWANMTGFSIDHGPMAIMIDNYLEHDFVPQLFMSHAGIANALTQLFPAFETLTISIASDSITENDGPAATSATVTRNSSDSSADLIVGLANGDDTEISIPATVTIPANQTSISFDIDAVDDDLLDGRQTATISVSATGFQPTSDSLEVLDHEPLSVVVSDASIVENDGPQATIGTVTRSNLDDLSQPLTVALTNGDDTEIAIPATVTILANQAAVRFDIGAVDDDLFDNTQTATITAAAAGYESGSDSLDVLDHETLTISVADATIEENDGTQATTATVTRSNTDNSSALIVTLTNGDDTEIAVPATVTIPANQASLTLDVDAVDDDLLDGPQTVTITAAASGYESGGNSLKVLDHETLMISLADAAIREDDGTQATMATITRSNVDDLSQPLTVTLTNGDDTEINIPNMVMILANQASATIDVDAVDDSLPDGTQTVTLTASAAGYVDGAGSLNVLDYETLTLLIAADSISENDAPPATMATVTRSSVEDLSQSLTVTLTNGDDTEVAIPADVMILAGQASATFDIDAVDDDVLDGTLTVRITASANGYEPGVDSLDVLDHETLTINIAADSIVESEGPQATTATVRRSNTDNSAELIVTLTNGDDTEIEIPETVTIPANQPSVTFDIDAVDDDLLDGTQTVTITPAASGYESVDDSVDVLDHEANITVRIDGNDLVIEDTSEDGVITNNALTVQKIGETLVITDPSNRIHTSIPGATGNHTNEVAIPTAAFTGPIIFDTKLGDDSVTLASSITPSLAASMHFRGGPGKDHVIVEGEGLDLQLNQFVNIDKIDLRGAGPNALSVENGEVQTDTNELFVMSNSDETVTFGSAWILQSPPNINGVFYRVLKDGLTTLNLNGPSDWTNPVSDLDVDNDGFIVPTDVLITITEQQNRKYSDGTGRAFDPVAIGTDADPNNDFDNLYRDVDGDGFFVPLDTLLIINFLNNSGNPEGAPLPAEISADLTNADVEQFAAVSARSPEDAGERSPIRLTTKLEPADSLVFNVESKLPTHPLMQRDRVLARDAELEEFLDELAEDVFVAGK